VLPARERTQCTHEEQVLLQGAVIVRDLVRGLDHDTRCGVLAVVARDLCPVGAQGLGLGHDVEAAALVELNVGDHERLEPRPELGTRAAHALRHGADLAVAPRQHGDDAVSLTQLVGANDDRFVSVEGHASIIRRGAT